MLARLSTAAITPESDQRFADLVSNMRLVAITLNANAELTHTGER